ncbi:hypothetical protein AAG570_000200 [Ranatra chinensis]|uniref:Superoxide dismutase [Cu-Zn] n=1 Tax=Ranatra chinensis TaxID=642074 RepID=A0ABD0YWD3_9HEMI
MGIIERLQPNKEHGFHIHEKGDLSSGCASAAGHFNPHQKHHGGPSDTERHVGDLGNIAADASGVAMFTIQDNLISLVGEHSVLGRAIVVHADKDDFGKGGFTDSLTTGHAGSRVGCGVIGIM